MTKEEDILKTKCEVTEPDRNFKWHINQRKGRESHTKGHYRKAGAWLMGEILKWNNRVKYSKRKESDRETEVSDGLVSKTKKCNNEIKWR